MVRTAFSSLTVLLGLSACVGTRGNSTPSLATSQSAGQTTVHLANDAAATAAVITDAAAQPSAANDHCAVFANRSRTIAQESMARAEAVVRQAIAENRDVNASDRRTLEGQLAQARGAHNSAEETRLTAALNALRERHFQQLRPHLHDNSTPQWDPFMLYTEGEVRCWPNAARHTAWGLMLTDAQVLPSGEDWTAVWKVSAQAVLAHTDATGAITTAAINTAVGENDVSAVTGFSLRFSRGNCCHVDGISPTELTLFDFDGDGEQEVLVKTGFFLEGDSMHWTELYQYKNGAIRPYPRPEGFQITSMEDVNHDQRPDLVSAPWIVGGEECSSGFPHGGSAPALAAISLADGTFSATNDAAKAYVASWCPSAPRTLNTVEAVVCARLWGRTTEDLRRQITRTQRAWNCRDEEAQRPQRDRRANRDYLLLHEAAGLPVYFSLANH